MSLTIQLDVTQREIEAINFVVCVSPYILDELYKRWSTAVRVALHGEAAR